MISRHIHRQPIDTRQSGFTLIELMVSIVVATILVTVGIPSFASLFESTRLSTESNNLIVAMNLARSEAVKRGSEVMVVQEDSTRGWGGGYKIGYDDVIDNDLDDANVKILQQWVGVPNSITVSNAISVIRFKADGTVLLDSSSISDVIALQPKSCTSGEENRRELRFSNTGKVNVVRTTCKEA